LQLTEILSTVVGESRWAGLPCVLVRLTGCPLRCRWCDATHAYTGGEQRSVDEVLGQVRGPGPRRVLVTGGEPLVQGASVELMRRLLDAGHEVLLETSGALPIDEVPPGVHRIVDVKPPSSGEAGRMHRGNLALLGAGDEVKFVVADRTDFEAALRTLRESDLVGRCGVLISPVHGELSPLLAARWILDTGLDLRLNLQLHKLAFGDDGDAALAALRPQP
jgi:7-carboxy-7-deazaguanine synthase